jgi:hypothetical protein
MMAAGPVRVRFTVHAERRCSDYGRSPREVAEVVLGEHQRRRSNQGSSDWLVQTASVTVAYNWPDQGDSSSALIVTLWPRL